MARQEMAPHDVIVDKDGIVWFSGFGEQKLGRLDPKTGKVTEYPYRMHRDNAPTGSLGLRADGCAVFRSGAAGVDENGVDAEAPLGEVRDAEGGVEPAAEGEGECARLHSA